MHTRGRRDIGLLMLGGALASLTHFSPNYRGTSTAELEHGEPSSCVLALLFKSYKALGGNNSGADPSPAFAVRGNEHHVHFLIRMRHCIVK